MKKKTSPISPLGGLRTPAESQVGPELGRVFDHRESPTDHKLDNFPKYIRRQKVTRYLALYELFKRALPVKGSIVECGVHEGFGLLSWLNFSAVLEPNNITRRIYGFDTFGGFPSVSRRDSSTRYAPKKGDLAADSHRELTELINIHDSNRFLGHVDKVHLVRGDVRSTVPEFVQKNGHLVVSLLFLDLDLFEPTRVCLEHFLPRMPKCAIIAFDELDNPIWPGETLAALESVGLNNLELERFDFDPYIAFARIPGPMPRVIPAGRRSKAGSRAG